MTFLEAMQALKEGKKVRNTNWIDELYLYTENKTICFSEPCTAKYLTTDDLNQCSWELYKEATLSEEEKEYLSNVIKPFKNRVTSIIKKNYCLLSNESFIQINVECSNDTVTWFEKINIPNFMTPYMYKNMETNYAYTIKGLDL